MGKSLTETAKAVLMKESNDVAPDRNAKSMNPNMATLRPGSGPMEPDPKSNDAQDLGPAAVTPTDVPPSAKAAMPLNKDTSGSSQTRKGTVATEKPKQQAEVMEEDVEGIPDVPKQLEEEDIELSEELEEFIDQCIAEGMTEDEIAHAIEENFEFISEEDQDSGETLDETAEDQSEDALAEHQVDMSEHVNALLEGEDLSEEFKTKATTIFESAVKTKLSEEVALIEQAFAATLAEKVEEIRAELTENVDSYLNYVVEQWISDNEVAIEAGLRTELTEDFISGLKALFEENFIDIPEDKVSVVEEMGSKIEELEKKLNEEIEKNVHLSGAINESKKEEMIAAACDGLTDTQAEKMKTLAEGVSFTDVNDFAQKVATIRENYFPTTVNSDNVLDSDESMSDGKSMISEELKGPMAQYVRVLGKKLPN